MQYRVTVSHTFTEDVYVEAASAQDAKEIVYGDCLAHNFLDQAKVIDRDGKSVDLQYLGYGESDMEANQAE